MNNRNSLFNTPWGLRYNQAEIKRVLRPSMRLDVSAGRVSRDWFIGFRPGDAAQTNGTCVGRGSANAAEILLMMHNPNALLCGEQLDGDRLYLWLRKEYYGDQDLDAGAQIQDGARALCQCGILPPDSEAVQIAIDQQEISEAYKNGPIIQGHEVDSAWENCGTGGFISDAIGSILGGHCTAGLGQWFFEDRDAEYCGVNSWGDGWANKSRYAMSWTRYNQTCVDLWQVRVNPESMKKWTGHRDWVMKRK